MSTAAQSTDATHTSDWAFKQLFKLESKCRSATPAQQVEAIGEFPKLLDQFPFPTLVSSAFLKLGDLFRGSPNSLRYHIAQVFGASQQHLTQITQTDELLKRILAVLYSNDSVARTLALRLVGNASPVFAKFPEAQHGILLRFQSSHPLEIAAAVQATEALLAYSPEFLGVVWKTVLGKAHDAGVPDLVRVQLIRSLQHAAPSLALSTLLYAHCQRWTRGAETTDIVRCAAMGTWRAITQPHNELQPADAAHVSGYVSHELASVRRAALRLLGKFRPQAADGGCSEGIRRRLAAYLCSPACRDMSAVDLGEHRLAVAVLARIEAVCGEEGPHQSWLAAQAHAEWALQLFREAAPATPPVLPPSSACVKAGIDPAYRCLASGVMLAINVATILGSSECRAAAAAMVRDAWLAIAGRSESADETRYVRRFLRTSWSWCRAMRVESTLASALKDMVGSRSRPVACRLVAIGSSARYFDCVSGVCGENIDRFVAALDSADPAGCNKQAGWHALAIVLAHQQKLKQQGSEANVSQPAADAIAKWSQHVCSLAGQPGRHAEVYAATCPPSWMFQRTMSLLSACGHWSVLHTLCQAPPMHMLSGRVQSWFYAVSSIARAEAGFGNTALFAEHADLAIRALRSLDSQGTPCLYRLFVVQLRRELVCLHDEWQRLLPVALASPAACFVARSLTDRTRALARQTEFVCNTLSSVDASTRGWLARTHRGLQRVIYAAGAAAVLTPGDTASTNAAFKPGDIASTNAAFKPDDAAIAAALADVGKQVQSFCPGSSFFSEPPRPSIFIETRPDIEGSGSPFAVFTGTEFHFGVEGFVRLPQCPVPATAQRIRIAAWLSNHPLGS
ncbi:hypothetical protein IWW50_005611, partial [Coemansia erecta]